MAKARSGKVGRSFYARRSPAVARDLLGLHLVRVDARGRRCVGRIVEVEAYRGAAGDRASHAFRGKTARTATLFGPPGHAYVYLIYGIHHCLNLVTEREGHGGAVLIRALEPVENLRGRTSGPGLLCAAMGIDRSLDGEDLCGETLFVERPPERRRIRIASARRIGVDYAGAWAKKRWRFLDRDSSWVSRPAR